ncbi:MAG: DNA gyrase/topoisomerase IV subunit A [Saprospiraceae bacterium]
MKENSDQKNESHIEITLDSMYQDYFLDYASYVILERAVPGIIDGLKPVQKRILHAMKEMDDGRFHKVANIIGQTMQYHPHGDAAIGDALVNLGQRELMIDTQGNWGDIRTGDRAAASRYIEARLTKFALEVAFNPQTTEWQLSYDGRKKEPVDLPVKFPLLLAQGVEGIAVGLSTKILPHNFIELIKASIRILENRKVQLYPDFLTYGKIDVSDYNDGKRGGRVKVRATIEMADKSNLVVRELPYGVTTSSLIDSILKATEKGKIKIKRISDNTAKEVEILIELMPGTSPDLAIDALYAFTDCEISIAPNACVIINDKPHFLTVTEILEACTANTKRLLGIELAIKKRETEEKWHLASLEKIFISNRIYRDIEDCESWEEVIQVIEEALKKFVVGPSEKVEKGDPRLRLKRAISEEDIVKLTEIRIKKISKYNQFKAEEIITELESLLQEIQYHIEHLTEYTIDYFKDLLQKYGKGRERRTEIMTFDTIQATEVVANNAKLFVNRAEGFIGSGLKKDELVGECSDIDDVIVFLKDGQYKVVRMADKVFVGKNIIHVAIWKKGDERTTYNSVYLDGSSGKSYVKRFQVTAITRDRDYHITKGETGSRLLYFSANPNGESEIITTYLTAGCKARIKVFDFDFSTLEIKGRGSQGNVLTKYPVRKVERKEVGKSTLGAIQYWMDEVSGKLNTDERGLLLGDFDTGDQLLAIYQDGHYELIVPEVSKRLVPNQLMYVGKYDEKQPIGVVYFDGEKGWTMVKRFQIETQTSGQKFCFISDHPKSSLLFVTIEAGIHLAFEYGSKGNKLKGQLDLDNFIELKGWKAKGNKLSDSKISKVEKTEPGGQTSMF